MKAFIVTDDSSFKLKVDYHPKIHEALKNVICLGQITKTIKRYPIERLRYTIDCLLALNVEVEQVKAFKCGEKEFLACLYEPFVGYDNSERFEVSMEYRPAIIEMYKSLIGARYDSDTQRWNFFSTSLDEFRQNIEKMGHRLILVDETHKFPIPKKRVYKALLKTYIEKGFIEAEIDYKPETAAFLKSIDAKFDGITKRWNLPITHSTKLIVYLNNERYSFKTLEDDEKFKCQALIAKFVDLSHADGDFGSQK